MIKKGNFLYTCLKLSNILYTKLKYTIHYVMYNLINVISDELSSTSESEMEESVNLQNMDVDVDPFDVNIDSSKEISMPGPAKPQKIVKTQFINQRLVACLDKCIVSDRFAIHILIATAEALGHNAENLIISRSSIQRCRQLNRAQEAAKIKKNFRVKKCSIKIT